MTTQSNPNNQRKVILKDPVACYNREISDGNPQDLQALKNLCEQYRSEQKQHKLLQEKTRQLSRQIGEAKKMGDSIDQLKKQTQEKSGQAKNIAKQIKTSEENILQYFSAVLNMKTQLDDSTITTPVPELSVHPYPNTDKSIGEITVSLLSNEEPQWNQYVDKNPACSIYHRYEWKQVIEDTFGHQTYYYIARNTQNEVVGLLPLIRLKSVLFGDFLVSMPYFNYGGAIADHSEIEQQLMTTANTLAEKLQVQHIEYRDDISRANLPVQTNKVNMILALPSDEDGLWQGFTPKLRAQIKRPQRENPEVFIGKDELLDEFYNVFAHNMRDLGTPVYARSFFKNILTTFPLNSHILVIRWQGQPVAAAFLIGHNDTLEIPWASTLRKVNHLSMNMLMYWEVLRFAIKKNYKQFDFGRSTRGAGTYRFKLQWGAKPKPLYWHYWLPEKSELPSLNPSNPKYALMIYVWKRLPVFVTRWLGPLLVKNLP
ncbi:FIG070318: hypothetical protein [hydrothermal vent metagenome]|uniref:BioF2-like acetyltransferase domain-containing protein n=1 Tax=hydrothermal vent metagenome TaxID=652676 RepID=A0A3B0Y7P7_9ZZZZ